MATSRNVVVFEFEILDKGKIKQVVDGQTKSFKNLDSALASVKTRLNQQGAAAQEAGKKNLMMMNKTGLAGAVLTEFTRTISDMNYGIRGVANNLSQLSTLFITLVATTNGAKNAMKLLWMQLKGPLGIVLALQVGITLLERWSMSSDKAAKETDKLAEALAKAGGKLSTLTQLIDRGNLSQEELNRVVTKLNKQYPDFNIQLDKNGKLTEESRIQIDKKINSLQRLAKAAAIQTQLEEIYTKEIELELNTEKELDEARKEFADNEHVYRLASTLARRGETKTLKQNTEEAQRFLGVQINSIKRKAKEEQDELNKSKDRLLDMLEAEELADEIIKDKKDKVKKREKVKQIDFTKVIKSIRKGADDDELSELEKHFAEKQKLANKMRALRRKEALEERKEVLSIIKQSADGLQEVNQVLFGNIEAQRERELSMIDARTQKLLANENLTASERTRILEQAEEAKRKINERSIKQELKMAQIKAGIMAAQLAAEILVTSGVIAVKGAENLAKAGPNPAMIAAWVAQSAVIAGMFVSAKQKANAAIAQLNAQAGEFSASPSSESVSEGGANVPNFNIVGQSQTSQLANTISNITGEPVRAYVVSDDITSMQELQNKVLDSASIG